MVSRSWCELRKDVCIVEWIWRVDVGDPDEVPTMVYHQIDRAEAAVGVNRFSHEDNLLDVVSIIRLHQAHHRITQTVDNRAFVEAWYRVLLSYRV